LRHGVGLAGQVDLVTPDDDESPTLEGDLVAREATTGVL
jgi:hypothetical protein